MRSLILLLISILLYGCNVEDEPNCNAYSKKGTTHYWDGGIEDNSYKCFEWADFDRLVINSRGGSVEGAAQIITDIKLYQIDTVVEISCNSACVYIASSGINKTASCLASFGIHKSSEGDINSHLYGDDVNQEWLKSVSVDYENLYKFGTGEAIKNNIINTCY